MGCRDVVDLGRALQAFGHKMLSDCIGHRRVQGYRDHMLQMHAHIHICIQMLCIYPYINIYGCKHVYVCVDYDRRVHLCGQCVFAICMYVYIYIYILMLITYMCNMHIHGRRPVQ